MMRNLLARLRLWLSELMLGRELAEA